MVGRRMPQWRHDPLGLFASRESRLAKRRTIVSTDEQQTVVFLHALGAWPQAWDEQVSALPGPYVGIAPRIHGVVEAATVPFDFVAAADDLSALIDQRGSER